ncbi:hypothetical protein LXM60_00635 [Pandoraea sputorum]|uniref:hypothetical protein n=1 Tax=Pandoraea sputorum TaxID=93222 RepID=UPI001E537475|nr:hypothetical protein [Pandoraea sputorum]MCE4058715.1 hypothetical protein [Pandoraea sputorum]
MEIGVDRGKGLILNKPPESQTLRRSKRYRDLKKKIESGQFWNVAERGIPEFLRGDFDLNEQRQANVDKRDAVVKLVLEELGERSFLNGPASKAVIKRVAIFFGISQQMVREYFERYLFYGGHERSQYPHDANKGASGVTSRKPRPAAGAHELRSGAPTSAERVWDKKGGTKKSLTPGLAKRWALFAVGRASKGVKSLTEVANEFVKTLVGYNRASNGDVVAYPRAEKYIPSIRYLVGLVSKAFSKARHAYETSAAWTSGGKRQLSGREARQLAESDRMVFDMDATVLDNYLKYGGRQIVFDGVERPTLLLAVDRGSCAIVGWHIYFGPENNEAYRSCLFSAFTPKERELVRWNVQHLTGMVYGCASKIFVDRGPGVSEEARLAIVESLKVHMVMARPGDPRGKGHVESILGQVMKRLSKLPGSTHTTGDEAEDRVRRLSAKKAICPTLDEFMRAFLSAVDEHNRTLDCRKLLTDDMLKAGVEPVPKGIFDYNYSTRRGRDMLEWPEEEIYKRLCTRLQYTATNGKVVIKNHSFFSASLNTYAQEYYRMNSNRWPKVNLLRIPNAPNYLIWERDDQRLEVLNGNSEVRNSFIWVNDYVNLLANVGKAKADKAYAESARGSERQGPDQNAAVRTPAKMPKSAEEAKSVKEAGRAFAEDEHVRNLTGVLGISQFPANVVALSPGDLHPPKLNLGETININF